MRAPPNDGSDRLKLMRRQGLSLTRTRGRASTVDAFFSGREGCAVAIASGLGGWRVNGGNEEQVGTGGCRAGAGDRFALALISLALDEVDATEMLRRHRRRFWGMLAAEQHINACACRKPAPTAAKALSAVSPIPATRAKRFGAEGDRGTRRGWPTTAIAQTAAATSFGSDGSRRPGVGRAVGAATNSRRRQRLASTSLRALLLVVLS